MRISSLFTLILSVIGLPLLAQSLVMPSWKEIPLEAVSIPAGVERPVEPDAYFVYETDFDAVFQYLSQAPREFTPNGKARPLHFSVPMANGEITTFAINESVIVGERVYQQYPDIRSFSGYALRDPDTRIKITLSPYWGFQGTIRRGDKGMEFIEQIYRHQTSLYMVYDQKAFPAKYFHPELQTSPDFVELPEDYEHARHNDIPATVSEPQPEERGEQLADPVTLKLYRFACATTGEFGQDHGGTIASLLPAMVNYVSQLNAIYEPELAIRLTLIDNVESILFTNPATDPYTGTLVPGWRQQNPEAMIQTIGFDQYDIGHVFARYIEGPILGQATLSSCCTDFKGMGCSGGYQNIYGVPFLNTIGHEIGHQWSALHTWNHCAALDNPESTPGGNMACEPGSGTTIMSYAGACGAPDDISGGTLGLYYNICSLNQIKQFLTTGAGATCGTTVVADNRPPSVEILTAQNLTIPISTPFVVKCIGTDPDGDNLSYCWEQADIGPSLPLGQSSLNSPLFRSYPPTTSPERTFPRIQSIALNQATPSELLPTYTRNMKFAITVRDDRMGGGGVVIDTLFMKSSAAAGPFRVSYPNNSAATWKVGEYQTVTWSVANTDVAPVNCKTVNIKLSTDAGITYPITLATNQPNTGSACVAVPNNIGNTNRIRVEAADHIFFDISNANFKIEAPASPGFGVCVAPSVQQACVPGLWSVPVSNNAWSGFAENVTYNVDGLPAGAVASFSANPVVAGTDVMMNVDFDGAAEGTYDLKVIATAGTLADTATVTVTVVSNNFSGFAITTPANGSSGVSQSPNLQWNTVTDANSYQVQVATNPSFAPGTIIYEQNNVSAGNQIVNAGLAKGTLYYWRVRPVTDCGGGAWSDVFVFATQVDACATYHAEDLPKIISSSNTNPVESVINISGAGAVSDVNVKNIQLQHNAFNQLEVRLVPPSGGNGVLLFKNRCGLSSLNMDAGFDDAAGTTTFPCPAINGVTIKPNGLLSDINGQSGSGAWKLWIKDSEIGSGGSISAFSLEVCSAAALNAPYIVNNNTLSLQGGTNASISGTLLKSEDADDPANELVYTLISVPANGVLDLTGWGTLQVGDQFTQAQIDAGALRFFDYGGSGAAQNFHFAVSDGNGGMVAGVFQIAAVVAANDLFSQTAFSLSPNPAADQVRLDFGSGLKSDAAVTIQDAAGRALRQLTVASGTANRTIHLQGLSAGAYFVTVRTAQGVATRRLVVQ